MNTNQLMELVQRYHENCDFITNEETAKVALVVPFIRLLGYDPSMPREVRAEYQADFTQGDGKKLPDRMDFAIFDATGTKALMVIETKPLGTDLQAKSQQLARYIAQLSDLHFGIITDGCHYLFFGDLENPNTMDRDPFFTFALDDPKTDWAKVAKFLSKFSRDAFNADTLFVDAENSRYRQAMIEKLATALKAPADDEGFMKWLTEDVYKGKRTDKVMSRLGDVAKEAIEPALFRVIGDDFLDKLKERIQRASDGHEENDDENMAPADASPALEEPVGEENKKRKATETTAGELEFYGLVREICIKAGFNGDDILYRDTINYMNVSYLRPTKWFVRFFSGGRRMSLVTTVPVEEAQKLVHGFEVEPAPHVFGVSRVYLDTIPQLWGLQKLITRSLEIMQTRGDDVSGDSAEESVGAERA